MLYCEAYQRPRLNGRPACNLKRALCPGMHACNRCFRSGHGAADCREKEVSDDAAVPPIPPGAAQPVEAATNPTSQTKSAILQQPREKEVSSIAVPVTVPPIAAQPVDVATNPTSQTIPVILQQPPEKELIADTAQPVEAAPADPPQAPDVSIALRLRAWLMQKGSTLRLLPDDGDACRTFADSHGREIVYASFQPGNFDWESLQVQRQGFANVWHHGEQRRVTERERRPNPGLLLHGIAEQGVRYGMESIANNRVKVGSSFPHGVYHIAASTDNAYRKLDFYNSGCVLVTCAAGFVADRDTKNNKGKDIRNPYDWLEAAYKGVIVSQTRSIGREYVVHPKSLIIVGAMFDKAVLLSFLSTEVETKWIQQAACRASPPLRDADEAESSTKEQSTCEDEEALAALAPCAPDFGVRSWVSTQAREDTKDVLEPVPTEETDEERTLKYWRDQGLAGVWGDPDAPDGIQRTRSRSRTPPGVRRRDTDYKALFENALQASREQWTSSSVASSRAESKSQPLPSIETFVGDLGDAGHVSSDCDRRALGTAGLEMLVEKDGEAIFFVNADKVSVNLLQDAMWACQAIWPEFTYKWAGSGSRESPRRWRKGAPAIEIIDLPGGVSAGALGSNARVRTQALALACVTAHYAFRQVDSGEECPRKAEFKGLVESACEALTSGNDVVTRWKGREQNVFWASKVVIACK